MNLHCLMVHLKTRWKNWTTLWQKIKQKIIKTAKWGKSHQNKLLTTQEKQSWIIDMEDAQDCKNEFEQ